MKKLTLLLLTSLAIPSMAVAATDGTIGATSTGNVNISFVAEAPVAPPEPEVEIFGLEDFNFGSKAPDDPMPSAITISNICVYLTVQGTYSLALEGDQLTSSGLSGGDIVPYTATYTDPVSGTSLVHNATPPGFGGASTKGGFAGSNTFGSCAPSELASLEIALLGDVLHPEQGQEDFDYFGTLTLTVSPE